MAINIKLLRGSIHYTGDNWRDVEQFLFARKYPVAMRPIDPPIFVVTTPYDEQDARPGDWIISDKHGNLSVRHAR